jgi:hypothetical protein
LAGELTGQARAMARHREHIESGRAITKAQSLAGPIEREREICSWWQIWWLIRGHRGIRGDLTPLSVSNLLIYKAKVAGSSPDR